MSESSNIKGRLNQMKRDIIFFILDGLSTSTMEVNDGWYALHHDSKGEGYGVALEPYDETPVITQVNKEGMVIVEDGGDSYNETCNEEQRSLNDYDVEILISILEIVEQRQPQPKTEDL